MKLILDKISKSLYSDICYNKDYSKIYKIHKYWARKPWYIVEKYIQHYSVLGDLVLDPFCGSGCTGLEAVINGRNFRGQDLNPIALEVTRGTLLNTVDLLSLEMEMALISAECKGKIMDLYKADEICPTCGGHKYFKFLNVGPKFSGNISGCVYCPCCNKKSQKRGLNENESNQLESLKSLKPEKWVPDTKFPVKFYKDRFSYKNIHKVTDMYTSRNLYALAELYDAIQKVKGRNHRLFLLAFTNTILHVSKLKGENVRPLGVNNYWVPDDYIEENVWFRFEDRVRNLLDAKFEQLKRENEKREIGLPYGKWNVIKKSATKSMGNETVDYVFTDPPYGDAIQYSELSFMWNAWLEKTFQIENEVIINPVQKKTDSTFEKLLFKALKNIYQALKPEKYFTLCFQNKNSKIWKSVISYCKELGFQLIDTSIYDTYGSPFNKSWANFSPKSDIYVTFKKTNKSEIMFYKRNEDIETIIKEIASYMESNKISKNNNKLYDLTISYLIWAMFYNEEEINVQGFDIKKFTQIANKVLG